jgi:hypothetical protein
VNPYFTKPRRSLLISAASLCALLPSAARSHAAATPTLTPVITNLPAARPPDPIGPNHRTWFLTNDNAVLATPDSAGLTPPGKSAPAPALVEYATGLNFFDGEKWTAADGSFSITNGWFTASRVQHPVVITPDLYSAGAFSLTTPAPDSLSLSATPLAIALYDAASGLTTVLATVTNCSGSLAAGGKSVVFPNAFGQRSVCASVVYSIEKATVSQDIVFTGRFDPGAWGYATNSKSVFIQIITELYGAAPSDTITRPLYVEKNLAVRQQMQEPDVMDHLLGWGSLVLGGGKAFTTPSPAHTKGTSGIVAKTIKESGGRRYLVESVRYLDIRDGLLALPDCGTPLGGQPGLGAKSTPSATLAALPALPSRVALFQEKKTDPAQVALASNIPDGVVVDWVANIGGTLNNPFVFHAATNWFISAPVFCNGPVELQSAVLKFAQGASVNINNTLAITAGSFKPAVLTCVDDDSVGASFQSVPNSGYTGVIDTNGYASPALHLSSGAIPPLSFLRICYAREAVHVDCSWNAPNFSLAHSQLINCIVGIGSEGSGVALSVNNCLFANVGSPLVETDYGHTWTVQQSTFDHASQLYSSVFGSGDYASSLAASNCIFANIGDMSAAQTVGVADYNGFYNADCFGSHQTTASSSPFQQVGAGAYYLANDSSFLTSASTNAVTPDLLASLRTRTVSPPTLLSNVTLSSGTVLLPQTPRDSGPNLALGVHSDPIDYLLYLCAVNTNDTLQITNGCVLAYLNGPGLLLKAGASLYCEGAPEFVTLNRYIHYLAVQEQPIRLGAYTAVPVSPYRAGGAGGPAKFRFTDFFRHAGSGVTDLYADSSWKFTAIEIRDCSFQGASSSFFGPSDLSFGLTNNLFESGTFYVSGGFAFAAYNNLFHGNATYFECGLATPWLVRDNAFDSGLVEDDGGDYPVAHDHNALIREQNLFANSDPTDIVLTNFVYTSGRLGGYYQVSTDLLHHGDTNANLLGMFHYCVTTNLVASLEIKETNSVVTIGLHRIAADGATGKPIDTDGDLLPDYAENRSGTGTVAAGETDWHNPDTDGDGLTDYEEIRIPLDMANLSLGFLDPLSRDTRGTGVPDGQKDSDHDGLSNLGELRIYHSDPTNSNTFDPAITDADFLLTAITGDALPPRRPTPLPPLGFQWEPISGSVGHFTISGFAPGVPADGPYDLYVTPYVNSQGQPPSPWKLLACGSPGQREFYVPIPPAAGFFAAAPGSDADGDGVKDGFERLVCQSTVDVSRSDGVLPDAWKVQWGLNPAAQTGSSGPGGNPDTDAYDNQTELAVGSDPWKSGTPRTVVTIAVEDAATVRGATKAATFRISRSNSSGDLWVTNCVGGTARYGTDYTLDPAPPSSSYPFSIKIPDTQNSVLLKVKPLGTGGAGPKTVVVGLVPFWMSYAPSPADWTYVVEPKHDRASASIFDPKPAGSELAVAIHDSELTRALGSLSSSTWSYALLVESIEEALRSDGTPFVVVSDADIADGALMANSTTPKYPILISLASEVISDDTSPSGEIQHLLDYVNAGGFVLAGSSAFTKKPTGTFWGDFALGDQMGVHCSQSPNWVDNYYVYNLGEPPHRLVELLPAGALTWRMPVSPDEISWGVCSSHILSEPQKIWGVSADSSTTVAASGDSSPYLTAKQYGSGYFIYHAAFQPLVGHGGNAPGMYAYSIFRKAIEWAFEANVRPVVRLSPWPYPYDAAMMVRHDLENFFETIQHIEDSASLEFNQGAFGDYYFCTMILSGANAGDQQQITAQFQRAWDNYHANIASHNGGFANPSGCTSFPQHWGTDEALDLTTTPFPSGRACAFSSLATSFHDIETWLPKADPGNRIYVTPNFNGTREPSYAIQEDLNVKVTGDQKLTPFPSWVLSTQTPGKRYGFLSEPVSDWFIGGTIAQSLDSFDPVPHSVTTVHAGIDAYYKMGALINFYSHTLADGVGPFGTSVTPEYIAYTLNSDHPRVWSTNANGIYQWWLQRSDARITASSTMAYDNTVTTTILVSESRNYQNTVELLVPSGTFDNVRVSASPTGHPVGPPPWRANGNLIKVGTGLGGTIANVVTVQYVLHPAAQDDNYLAIAGTQRTVSPAAGVLQNDVSPTGLPLVATGTGGSITPGSAGGFTFTPNSEGTYTFTYNASDGVTHSADATARIRAVASGAYLAEDFSDPGALSSWTPKFGKWSVTGGSCVAGPNRGIGGIDAYGTIYLPAGGNWSGDYTIEARIRFQAGGYGGGIGGRVSGSGAGYEVWIYPEDSTATSPVGPKKLALVKFPFWGGNWTTVTTPVNLGSVGTDWHTLKVQFSGAQITVFLDDLLNPVIQTTDNNNPLNSGGICMDMYTDGGSRAYGMFVDYIIVTP